MIKKNDRVMIHRDVKDAYLNSNLMRDKDFFRATVSKNSSLNRA